MFIGDLRGGNTVSLDIQLSSVTDTLKCRPKTNLCYADYAFIITGADLGDGNSLPSPRSFTSSSRTASMRRFF